jgi:hypothetical protein
MALVLNDRVNELSTSIGTSQTTWTLNGAQEGFVDFTTGIGVGNTTYYTIHNQGTDEWEVGLGTLSSSTNLQRTTIITSSNSNNVVNFSAGNKSVFCTYPASKTPDMILTAQSDILYASSANILARLPKGTAGQVLQMNVGATAPEWATPSSGATEGFAVAMAIAL